MVEVPVVVMALLLAFWPPLPMAFSVRAEDLRQRIIITMAATVKTTPPITADRIVIKGRLSAKDGGFSSALLEIKSGCELERVTVCHSVSH